MKLQLLIEKNLTVQKICERFFCARFNNLLTLIFFCDNMKKIFFNSRKEVQIMITVEGSTNDELIFDSTYIKNPLKDSSSITPQDVIKTFMKSLDNATSSNATTMLDDAIKACSNFSGIDDAINHFINHLQTNGASKFLTDCCGIILNNTDTGAITGLDAGSSTSAKTASSIVNESGSLNTSFSGTSFATNGLTIKLGTSYEGTDSQKTIWQALYTWWIDGSLDLISDSYGSNFSFTSNSSATVDDITVQFYTSSNDGALASVSHNYDSSGKTTRLTLNINMHYYGSINSTNIDEDGKSSLTSAYLDRVLAHEFTHAVMAANITNFDNLPLFIIEGMAELTHGIDDLRPGSINYLLSNVKQLKNALKMTTSYGTADYQYAAGYMFLRYLAYQGAYGVTEGTAKKDTLNNNKSNVEVYAYAGNDKITNYGDNVTIIAGKGNDSITLGGSSQVIEYTKGDGKDFVSGWNSSSDVIKIDSGNLTKASIVKKTDDLLLTINKGSIRLEDMVGKKLHIIDADDNDFYQTFGTNFVSIADGDGTLINYSIDNLVETIDASSRTTDLNFTANKKANYIKLSKSNETITAGKGKDTVEFIGGNILFTDYTTGQDVIKFDSDFTVSSEGSDFIFTTDNGSITVEGAYNKKGVAQKITVVDKDGIMSSQVYGNPTLNVSNSDGDTLSTENNTEVTIINASKRSKPIYIIGNSNDNTIKAGSKDDTIEALTGNDYLTGGKGNDLFIYSAGRDTISDYAVAKNNSDAITLSGVTFDTYSIDGKNAIISFEGQDTNTSLTILNAKDKSITINGNAMTLYDINEKIFTKSYSASSYVSDSDVVTISAANNSTSINIVGNAKNNFITGSKNADTLNGGSGDDYLKGGKGKDLFIYSSGNDTIADYVYGTDQISVGADISSVSYNGNDLIFKIDNSNSLTILNAKNKKGKEQKISIVDGSNVTSQVYGNSSITISAGDGNTIDLSRNVNSVVTNIYAGGRKVNAPIKIIGNDNALSITDTKGNDTIQLSTANNRGKATINYVAGADTILNFNTDDVINLSTGQSIQSATKVSETNYKLQIVKKKNSVGTLDISGSTAYTTTNETSNSVVTSYVNIGGHKIAYATETLSSSAAYEERLYQELFDDDLKDNLNGLDDILHDKTICIDESKFNSFESPTNFLTYAKMKEITTQGLQKLQDEKET